MTAQPAAPRYSDIQAEARAAAKAVLERGEGLTAAAHAAIATADSFWTRVVATVGLDQQVAAIQCGAGCFHCCHQMVGVTAAELELVRAAVAALPEPLRGQTRARIKKVAARGKKLDQAGWWRAKLRCALLDDQGRCLVHEARPLPCRAMNSSNAETCRRSLAGESLQIPVLAAQHKVWGSAQLGLAQAVAEAGHGSKIVNLGTAL